MQTVTVTIRITLNLKLKLDKAKVHPRETYDQEISRLLEK